MNSPEQPQVSSDGTVTVPSFVLPLSAALSPEANAYMARALSGAKSSANMVRLEDIDSEADYRSAVDAFRANLNEKVAKPLVEKLLADFPVDIQASMIAGVPVEEFTPKQKRDDHCVLINLHGGAFYGGAVHIGRVESIPLCAMGGFRIISVDYRQGYEHKYPAASEDVCAVYSELLKTYPAERIAIYGGSAGGTLTMQATAWILAHDLPAPGAIGVFGAGADGSGDAAYFSAIGSGRPLPADTIASLRRAKFGYLSDSPANDPLSNPNAADEAFRAKFPPCLFITGTRAFDLSPAIASHRALSQAGVEASLHVFDGLAHCFYYQAYLPEGRDAYQTMVRFFRKHLTA